MKWSTLWGWVTVEVTFEINIEEWVFPVGREEGPSETRKLYVGRLGSIKREIANAYSGHFKWLLGSEPAHVGKQPKIGLEANGVKWRKTSYEMSRSLSFVLSRIRLVFVFEQLICAWLESSWRECEAGTEKNSEDAALVIQARDDATGSEG